VVGANLAVVLVTALANKQMLIIRVNVWRLIDALTNYSFQQGI